MSQSSISIMALELSESLAQWSLWKYRVEIEGSDEQEDPTITTRRAASSLSYANQGNVVTSLGHYEVVSAQVIKQPRVDYNGITYRLVAEEQTTLQANNVRDREAMERLLNALLRLGVRQLCSNSNGTLVSLDGVSKEVKLADAVPSQRVPATGSYLQAYQTVTLTPEVLPCGAALVSIRLKHELVPEPHVNMDWVARHKHHWLSFIKKARHSYKNKNGQFATLDLHGLAENESCNSVFSTARGEFTLLQYHTSEGNIGADQVEAARSSSIFNVSYGSSKKRGWHLGQLIQPMFDFDTLSQIDPDLLGQIAKRLKWPVDVRVRAAFSKIRGLKLPILDATLVTLTDESRYLHRLPLDLKLEFAKGRIGKDEKDVLTRGAFKSMHRPLVAGLTIGGDNKTMEKHFKEIRDRCSLWGVESNVRWTMVEPAEDHHELARRLSQRTLEPSLLVIGIGPKADKVKIRDVAYRYGHATQFMRLDHKPGQYNSAYYNNLAAGVFSKGGGMLCALNNMPGEADLFIGLDMGGTSQRVPGSAFLFNREGAQLGWQLADAQTGERMQDEALHSLLERSIRQFQQSQNGTMPKGVVLHRDGHFYESIEVIERLQAEFNVPIDVLEVIKTGAPALMRRERSEDNKKVFQNPQLGDAFEFIGRDELIMATYSGQELGKWGEQVTVRPLKLRKRFGDTPLRTLAQQVLALSRIHGASLYRHPRLPVTTHHADRFATLRQECNLDDLSTMDRLCPIYL